MIEQNMAVFNGSNTVIDTIQEKESTAGLVDNTCLDEGEFLLGMFGEVDIIVVTVFLCPGGCQPFFVSIDPHIQTKYRDRRELRELTRMDTRGH